MYVYNINIAVYQTLSERCTQNTHTVFTQQVWLKQCCEKTGEYAKVHVFGAQLAQVPLNWQQY